MTKAEIMPLWVEGDDAAVARIAGLKRQTVRAWRLGKRKSKHDHAIMSAAQELGIHTRLLGWVQVPLIG